MTVRILSGDARDVLKTLPDCSVQCCVTSPPYFGLRSYLPDSHPDKAREIGTEPSPDEYTASLVAVFRNVRRVLLDDGVVWLNLGDSYASGGGTGNQGARGQRFGRRHTQETLPNKRFWVADGIKPKDLIGIPWMVAFALRADGWYLRSEVIWSKPNPLPESVTDRPTKAHESLFLLSKSASYFYDAEAIKEPSVYGPGEGGHQRFGAPGGKAARSDYAGKLSGEIWNSNGTRNARSVWTIATQPYRGSHFATMPPALAERCIKAGSRAGDLVLDPFGGAGTTGLVADRLGRDAVLIELNADYPAMAERRLRADAGMFAEVVNAP